MKPTLAKDAILEDILFPCWVQPKIDGVRALNFTGRLTGRSLDEFEGFGISDYFSKPEFLGLDGEMTLGCIPNSTQRLCSATTGAMGRFKDVTEMADLHWWVFDDLSSRDLPYEDRYDAMQYRVHQMEHPRIHVVQAQVCYSLDDLKWWSTHWSSQGFEGTIIRNPKALFKEGRATKKGQELWRIKPWADAEILVTGITEGNMNTNEAKTNSLGRTERSSSAAGMVPNGQVGSIQGTLLADFHDPLTGELMFAKGLPCTVGSGEMTVEEAAYYFTFKTFLIGKVVKFKHMTHGVKDQPRFPTYLSHRLSQDM